MSQQYHAVVKKADVRWSSVSRSVSCKTGDVTLLLSSEPARTRSERLVQLWAPYRERHGPPGVRPGKGRGDDEWPGNRAKGRLCSGLTWRTKDMATLFWKVKGSCKQGPACSPCPIRVWRDRGLTVQEGRFSLCIKGKLLKVRLADTSNRQCGASGEKNRLGPLKLGR